MQLVWKKVSNAEGYEIYRSTKKDSGYKKIASLKRNADKYTDKSVKAGKKYYYKVVTVGKLNGKKITSGYSNPVSNRALSRVKISSANSTLEDAVKIKWKKVTGATKYKIYRATSSKGSYKHIATVKSNGKDTQSYTDKKVTGGKNYYYKVQAYSSSDGIIAAGKGDKSEYKKATLNYAIMGKSTVTVDQMVKFYNMSGKKYPSIYKDKGAKNIKKFCEILLDECEREGVRAEVIFAQVCLETGYLSFGGQVSAGQCNFSGLGATDDGAAGATFKDVRTGLRAQVQHLKGYASKDSLNQKCVDPRFQYLTHRRGSTPYVQNLGNGNWATDPNYASKLMTLIKKMKSC
jgi:Fibronectin type 3 domain-containing protein